MCTFAGAEVCEFDVIVGDENIFWFDVSVEDAFGVDVFDGL